MNKTILITGSAGLIGSRLADWITENLLDVDVIGVDDLSGGYIENVNKLVKFYQINLTSSELKTIFQIHKPDYVFHLAAYAAEGLSPFIRQFNYTNNLVSTANVINQCIEHNVKKLIFTSSLAVYGHGYGEIFNEDQIPSPIDPYGVAKYACEMDIKIAGDQHGLDWCIIRPHNVYGIKQNIWDKYRNVLGIWMYQYLNNEPMTIFGDGKQTRAFSYIDDILEPLWNSAIQPNTSHQIINLGGTKEYTISESNRILIDVMGGGVVEHKEQRHEVKNPIPTYQKSIDMLGYQHITSLKDGLTSMWNWAITQPNRKRFVWEEYEIEKNMYSFWKNK